VSVRRAVAIFAALEPQDAASMEALLREFKNDEPAVRDRAVQSALTRSAQRRVEDLETLRKAGSSDDADLARRGSSSA
jgi:hypothetical protein